MLRVAIRCEGQVRLHTIPEEEVTLGADRSNDLVAPFSGVSRRHATLRPLDGGLLVCDQESKNGLVVDGRRVDEVLLRSGDAVRIGNAFLSLEEVESFESLRAASRTPSSHTAIPRLDETRSQAVPPEASSPAAALGLVREVERAGSIDPTRLDRTVSQLARARRILQASGIWIWSGTLDGEVAVLVFSGGIPELDSGELRFCLEATSLEMFPLEDGDCTLLVAPVRKGELALLACLGQAPRSVPHWKRDLFAYLASKVRGSLPSSPPGSIERPDQTRMKIRYPAEFVRGGGAAMQRLEEQVESACLTRLDALLQGETGTGKELIARAIHENGPTSRGSFVAINCAAIPAELLDAQLFGVEARVATGVDPRPGLIAKAEGGTLFLDEVGDLPESVQVKLLRVLQEREVLPLGSTQPRKVRVRILSASNRDLAALVATGGFRADLYYRLQGLEIEVPPLRDRIEDLPELVLEFAHRAAAAHGKGVVGVSYRALSMLRSYRWPGNIRELKSAVSRAVLRCSDGGVIESRHIGRLGSPIALPGRGPVATPLSDDRCEVARTSPALALLSDLVADTERVALGRALLETRGNKTAAAKVLGISRAGLLLKLRRLGLS